MASKTFSYRCKYAYCCPILLSVPITTENYDETWRLIGTHGAYHPGLQAHSSSCNKKYQEESEIQLQQLLIEKKEKLSFQIPTKITLI